MRRYGFFLLPPLVCPCCLNRHQDMLMIWNTDLLLVQLFVRSCIRHKIRIQLVCTPVDMCVYVAQTVYQKHTLRVYTHASIHLHEIRISSDQRLWIWFVLIRSQLKPVVSFSIYSETTYLCRSWTLTLQPERRCTIHYAIEI